MLDELKRMTELDLHTLDAIAIAAGPGSFTGLRIGSATAKGLGLALKLPIIPVPTVDALAYNLYGCSALVCPLMDARRNQVYTGLYEFQKRAEDGGKYELCTLVNSARFRSLKSLGKLMNCAVKTTGKCCFRRWCGSVSGTDYSAYQGQLQFCTSVL